MLVLFNMKVYSAEPSASAQFRQIKEMMKARTIQKRQRARPELIDFRYQPHTCQIPFGAAHLLASYPQGLANRYPTHVQNQPPAPGTAPTQRKLPAPAPYLHHCVSSEHIDLLCPARPNPRRVHRNARTGNPVAVHFAETNNYEPNGQC
jgi:hypothetical protein